MIEREVRGDVPAKHHIVLRSDAGQLRYEECITRNGFDGPYTIMYHVNRPHTAAPAIVSHGWDIATARGVTEPLLRRHFQTDKLARKRNAPVDARIPLLHNEDVVVGVLRPTEEDPVYFVNGDADDLYYIHQGGGVLRSMVGDLRFKSGDYVYVPKGLLHRFLPDLAHAQMWLSMECFGGLGLLKQWRNELGQLRMDAPYCHRDFQLPEFQGPLEEGIRECSVKKNGAFHGFVYNESPLDVVGWDGTVYPFVFPILNFQPRVGLTHVPPTWHGTFATRGALICSFVPRLVDFHPEAIPCPYPHSAVDCDEVIFYCHGEFTSRKGIDAGSISYHPAGIPHGPHPGAYEKSIGTHRTDEMAVMLDTFKTLYPTDFAKGVEDKAYHASFV